MKDRVTLLTLLAIVSSLALSLPAFSSYVALAEESGGAGVDDMEIELVTAKSELSPLDETTLTALVHNNKKTSITVNKIELGPAPFEKLDLADTLILPNSSKPVSVGLKIPNDVGAGTYRIVVTVSEESGYTETAWTEITVKTKSSLIETTGLQLDGILLLLAVYIIPAQFIERIVEWRKKEHYDEDDHRQYIERSEEIKSITKIKDKLTELIASNAYKYELSDIFGKKIQASLLKQFLLNNGIKEDDASSAVKSLTEKEAPFTAYEKYVQKLDAKISLLHKENNAHEADEAVKYWGQAVGLAFPAGMLLAFVNLGIFQIVSEYSLFGFDILEYRISDLMILDSIFNALFIGSGTKPIHDIIEWIKKARTKSWSSSLIYLISTLFYPALRQSTIRQKA